MTVNEIAQTLDLPPNTNTRNLAARAIRRHSPGGPSLIDMKEWLSGVANFSDAPCAEIGREALRRLNEIQFAQLASIEIRHRLPAGCLTRRLRSGLPNEG